MESQCPFSEKLELYDRLELRAASHGPLRKASTKSKTPNFPVSKQHIPGHPRWDLDSPAIGDFLHSELATPDLDALSPRFWLLTTPSSSKISSLTEQIVRGRRIVITENPELHLVWLYDRIFVKPLPKYLLSHAFWQYYLCSPCSPLNSDDRKRMKKAAQGFVRSYAYLIRHRSDFELATQENQRLVPKVKFGPLVQFLSQFEVLTDKSVSPRFEYGQLRLTRLNFWTKIFLRKSCHYRSQGQYGDRLARTYGPLLFLFAILSVLMASFQVMLAVPEISGGGAQGWTALTRAAAVSALATLFILLFSSTYVVVMMSFFAVRETRFALARKLEKIHQDKGQSGETERGASV